MADGLPTVRWQEHGESREALWRSESGAPPPQRVTLADDRTRAEEALKQIRAGESLLYRGDYHNARQLLAALGRRVHGRPDRAGTRGAPTLPIEIWRKERARRATEHALLSRVLVPLDPDYRVALPRGPDARTACEPVWGPPDGRPNVVPLRELLGMIGAAQWREKGIEVAGLPGPIHPHYGVFTPTRGDYTALLEQAPSPEGKRVFDIGTGTGVLGFLLLARGAKEVVATDLESRAVRCANENADRLGYGDRFESIETDLFPEGTADLIVCNPPWVPERPRTALDRAVFDPGGRFLEHFLGGVGEHLAPCGQAWLIISDLPELLGLRAPGELEAAFTRAGLKVAWTRSAAPTHGRVREEDDPLHQARSRERTTLYALEPM